jgi:hypothetical protein
MAAFSDFYESHEPHPSGDARGITGAPPRPSKRPEKWVHFTLLICLLLPWRPPGQYGASSHLMAASSGFRCNPGHAALGDALRITSMRLCGHPCGPRRRYICSSPLPFLLGVILANDHVMVH